MSQLNLKQVLSGDTISTVVDKINYNFDQIVLNGGGPRGFAGLIGAPGLIGKQGQIGETGPTGPDGTYLYASGLTPGGYPFGTGGESLPRPNDVFLEGGSSYINIWTAATGASGLEWNIESTITAPGGGLSKIVLDNFTPGGGEGATFTSFANDPNVGGEFLLGSPSALFSDLVIDSAYNINSATPKKVAALSSVGDPVAGNSTLTVVSPQNQLRLLNFDTDFMSSGKVSQEGGGIVHNIQTTNDTTGATVQVYRIWHADTEGNKHFSLKFSSSAPNVGDATSLFYSDIKHRALIGGADFETLVARLSVNSSLAVGRRTIVSSPPFYQGATLSTGTITTPLGAVIEGNLAIGKNNNSLATAGFYNLGVSDGVPSTNLVIDAAEGASNAFSELQISSGFYANALESPGSNNNWWKFKHAAINNPANSLYTGLRLSGYSLVRGGSADTMYFSLTESGGLVRPRVGVNNIDPISLFEVGASATRIGIGDFVPTGGSGNSFISFNLQRSHTGTWTRRGNSQGNAGRAFWSNQTAGIGLSLFRSTSNADVTGITDAEVYDSTRLYINPRGWFSIAPTGNSPLVQSYPVVFNFGTLNTDPGSTAGSASGDNNVYKAFRRHIALFGLGDSQGIKGSPLISSTQGLTPSATGLTDSIFPQYTFHNDFGYGVYLAGGNTANGMTGVEVGFSVGGTAGITVVGSYGTEPFSPRLGINNRTPLSEVHVGKNITISESSAGIFQNFMGYNLYYDFGVAANRRIEGSIGTARGAAAIQFIEKLTADTTTAETEGTTIRLYPGRLGATGATFINNPIFPGGFNPTYVTPYVSVAPNFSASILGGDNGVPSVRIGMGATDTTGDSVLGSLSIAARAKTAIFGSLDNYNLTLYSREGSKGLGIRVANNGSGSRSFDMEYLVAGVGGPSLLTSSYNESNSSLRTVAFGNDFRVGVDGVATSDAAFYSRGSTTSPVGGATAAAKFDGDILIGEDTSGVFDIRTGGDNRGIITSSQTLTIYGEYYTGVPLALNGSPSNFLTNMIATISYKRLGRTVFLRVVGVTSSFTDRLIGQLYFRFSNLPVAIRPEGSGIFATASNKKTLSGSGVVRNEATTAALYNANRIAINNLSEVAFISCSVQPEFIADGGAGLMIRLRPIDKLSFFSAVLPLPGGAPASIIIDFTITYEL